MLKSIVAITLGASLGALLRWWLGLTLNSYFSAIPPGTLAANLIGGYIIGLAIAFFASYSALPPEWRLFVITGFCGGLTTFSTFSAEIVTLLQQQRCYAFGARRYISASRCSLPHSELLLRSRGVLDDRRGV